MRTSNPGAADVEDLATEGGERVWERVARLVDGLGEPGPDSGLHDVGAVVGATAPEHLARARELMPRTPFLLPGIGAQGGRVEDLAPAFAPGRAGGLVTRVARRSCAPTSSDGGEPARRRPPRGRAAARAGLVAWVIGPSAPRPMLRSRPWSNRRRRSIGRWLAPVALITCAVAVYAVVDNTLLKNDSTSGSNGSTQQSTTTKATSKKAAKSRKHRRAYIVKSGDTLSAISIKTGVSMLTHPAAEPQDSTPTRSTPASGSGSRGDAHARAAALLAALEPARCVARAWRARRAPPAAPPSIRAPAAILVEPTTGDVVFQREARRERPIASTTKLMTALVTLERAKLSQGPHHGALPRARRSSRSSGCAAASA